MNLRPLRIRIGDEGAARILLLDRTLSNRKALAQMRSVVGLMLALCVCMVCGVLYTDAALLNLSPALLVAIGVVAALGGVGGVLWWRPRVQDLPVGVEITVDHRGLRLDERLLEWTDVETIDGDDAYLAIHHTAEVELLPLDVYTPADGHRLVTFLRSALDAQHAMPTAQDNVRARQHLRDLLRQAHVAADGRRNP